MYQGLKKAVFIIADEATSPDTYMKYPALTPDSEKLLRKSNYQSIRVLLFNTFDSFSALGTKIKEKGEAFLSFAELKRMYGVEYPSLPLED